jgi:hypothetical protein
MDQNEKPDPREGSALCRINALHGLRLKELQTRYKELFGGENPPANKAYLLRRIAYKIQEEAFGGKPWGKADVARLLANPLCLGKVLYRGALYDGLHPGIVPPELPRAAGRRAGAGQAACQASSVNAQAIENAVVAKVAEIASTRPEYKDRQLAINTPAWQALFPQERRRVLNLLLKKVEYDGLGVKLAVEMNPEGIAALERELCATNSTSS